MKACLIGSTLKHSFSKQIHEQMKVDYDLCEVAQEDLQNFVLHSGYDNFNVTIPYKEQVIPFLDVIDDSAKAMGVVNTVCHKDGKLYGYNTDIDGMRYLFERKGVNPAGKNVVILGTGGTSKTAQTLMRKMCAKSVIVVGRRELWNYQNLYELKDTQILINTTPVGMYPNCNDCLVDLSKFENVEFVADVIYNPLKTKLLLQAEKLNIPCSNGLAMLVHQAVRAEEIWQGRLFLNDTERILAKIKDSFSNIVLVGMPSSGKTTVGKVLAKLTGKRFVDIDEQIELKEGRTIPTIFAEDGETYFREIEEQTVAEYSKIGGLVLSTGGGSVLRAQNRDALRQNGFVVWLLRDLNLLSSENRPVSQKTDAQTLFEKRKDFYQMTADCKIQNDCDIEDVAQKIKVAYEKYLGY